MVSNELLLKAEPREHLGSKHSAKLRSQGKVPAVIYGHKQAPESISCDLHEFAEGLHHGHRLFDVEFSGKKEKLLVKDLQYDYLGKKIIHIDFIRVNLKEKVKVGVPVSFKGTAKGAGEGGILEEHLDRLEIECTVVSIPEEIEVSVKDLAVGDSIYAKDVTLPAGVELLSEPESLLIACQLPKVMAEAEEVSEEGEEAASPEVITERKAEESESE